MYFDLCMFQFFVVWESFNKFPYRPCFYVFYVFRVINIFVVEKVNTFMSYADTRNFWLYKNLITSLNLLSIGDCMFVCDECGVLHKFSIFIT